TNDGDFANNIGHPSKGVVKTYKVSVRGELTRTVIKKIQFGIFSDGEKLTVKDIKISRNTKTGGTLAFKLVEGRKREIRRICAAVGLHVIRLRRTKMGSLTLSGLRPGKWKFLTDSDMRKIEK
ncbi:MAG: pseudouridine synthase, partial [Verrucomicrobiota bacterium]|nr:pseudouridine synthase [Verrucomicrobiota bacterium]